MARRTKKQPELPAPSFLGPGLAAIINDDTAAAAFSFAGRLLRLSEEPTLLRAMNELRNSQNMIDTLTGTVIAELSNRPELHDAAREVIRREDLRRHVVHDAMAMALVSEIEGRRIDASADPSAITNWEPFGVAPRPELHTDEDRAQAHRELRDNLDRAIGELEKAYTAYVIGIITGKIAPQEADQKPTSAIGPIADIDRPDGLIRLPSFQPVSALLNAIHSGGPGKDWDDHGGERVPTHATVTGAKTTEKGYIFVSVRGPKGSIEATETERAALWGLVHELDDTTSDVLIYCLAACMDSETPTWLHVDAVLNARKIEPRRKRGEPSNWSHGHRQKDRVTIGKALEQLVALHLELENIALPGQKKRLVWESPALVVIDRVTQEDLDGGRVLLAAQVQLGSWATKYREIKLVQFGYMAKKALEYNPKTEQAEKRLAKYFALHHRFNANDKVIPRSVRDILAAAEIPADPSRPSRSRARLEKALNRLVEDGVISKWRALIDADKIPARKGFDTWLKSMIEIEFSTQVQKLYSLPPKRNGPPVQRKSGKAKA